MRRSLPPPMMMRHPVVGGLIACLMTTLPIAVLAQNAATVSPQGAAATAAQQQQQQAAQQAAQQQAPSAATAARFVQSCNDSLERGVTDLGCQAPLYRNELERLKREALTTQNPQLLSFVGEAYRNPRTGLGDLGQAYRWYLLAAVRGDPMALQRLSELNRTGQGVPKDNVKALGYARLVERLSPPGSAQQRNVVTMISELGNEMALEEVALAVSFADQLEAQIRRQSGDPASGAENGAAAGHSAAPATNNPSLPGMAPSPAARIPGVGAPTPGTVLPGVPATRAQ